MPKVTDLKGMQAAYKSKLRQLTREAEDAQRAGCQAVRRRKLNTIHRLRKMKRAISEGRAS